MESLFQTFFPNKLIGKKYETHNEYINDSVKQAEMMIIYYLQCMNVSQQNLDKSISSINAAGNLDAFELNKNFDSNRDKVKEEFAKSEFFIRSRAKKTFLKGTVFTLEYLKCLYNLSELECFCLITSLLSTIDNKYEKVFAFLQNDPSAVTAGFDLMIKIYFFVQDISSIKGFYDIKSFLKDKMSSLCFDQGTSEISSRNLEFIMTNGRDPLSQNGVECVTPYETDMLLIREEIAQRLKDTVNSQKGEESLYLCLNAVNGIGKKTLAKRCASLLEKSLIIVDISKIDLKDGNSFYSSIVTACRESLITQGFICFTNFDVLFSLDKSDKDKAIEMVLNTSEKFSNVIFILTNEPVRDRNIVEGYLWINIPIEYPNKNESIKLWDACLKNVQLGDKIEPYEVANKFVFTPAQIIGTQKDAEKLFIWNKNTELTRKEFYDCAYNQIISELSKQTTLIYAKYTWKQLILAEEQKEMLKNACDQIKYKHIVYDKWGFNKRLAYGKGVSMLFAGPPGTGKTMAAQVVGNELNIEIYKVDLSQIVSKYIGETEKNLSDLFREAKKSSVILFFDETDALFGKRTEVKDSHDKNANLETSYLLQKIEEYDGITIMSTNYLENIDAAFFRRISYVIHFPFPDIPSRKKIWQTMFPKELPLDKNIDFDYLANQFEVSGGNIKNIAVTAAFLAAKSDKKLRMDHIVKAIKYELTKQGKTVLKEDFGEHGYLL